MHVPPLQSGKAAALALFVGVLEVVGDAVIRKGLRGAFLVFVCLGFVALSTYVSVRGPHLGSPVRA